MRRSAIATLCALAALAVVPSAHAARAHSSIVAGSAVSNISQAPYQVRVLIRSGNSTYQCGGSIRDATHVITAAHCLYINSQLAAPGDVSVGYGATSTSQLRSAAVSGVVIPKLYLSDDSYDIGILTLSTPLDLTTASVQAIPLATAGSLQAGVNAQTPVFATGWGATTEGGSSTSALRGVNVPLRSDGACTSEYGSGYIASRTVCAGGLGNLAGSSNPDTCQGDSGGPLSLPDGNGAATLAAITSYGNGCGRPGVPGAYTEVSSPDILPYANDTAPESSLARGGTPTADTTTSAPVVTTPVSATLPAPTPVRYDTTRPTASFSKASCTKRRKCTIRLRSRDDAGAVAKLSATVSRKVKTCKRRHGKRVCKTITRRKRLKVSRISGGFAASGTLAKATYTLTAVATDKAGNRSKTLTRRLKLLR